MKYPVIDVRGTGQNIKRIIQANGFAVKDVQEFLGLGTIQSIYHWFDGRNLPSVDNLYALSGLFQIPVDAMLVGDRKLECGSEISMYQRVLVYWEKLYILKGA